MRSLGRWYTDEENDENTDEGRDATAPSILRTEQFSSVSPLSPPTQIPNGAVRPCMRER